MNLITKSTEIFRKTKKKAKITYYPKMLHKSKTDSKPTWQVLKKITGTQKAKSNPLLLELKIDKSIVEVQKELLKIQ